MTSYSYGPKGIRDSFSITYLSSALSKAWLDLTVTTHIHNSILYNGYGNHYFLILIPLSLDVTQVNSAVRAQ